jgi:hypothetical protein
MIRNPSRPRLTPISPERRLARKMPECNLKKTKYVLWGGRGREPASLRFFKHPPLAPQYQ